MGVFVDGGWFHTAGDVWAEVQDDSESERMGWDGDQPLDARCNWHVVQVTLYRQGWDLNAEVIDSLSGIWVSDDQDGEDFLHSIIDQQLLDDNDDSLPAINNLEIVYK